MGSIFKRKAFKGCKDKPWMIAYTDENGIRKIMTGSPDKTVSKEILRAREAEVLRRKNGISSATDERFQHHANRPIEEHYQEYIKHCRHVGMSNGTIAMKEIHLKRMTKDADVQRLKDLEPNCVESFLQKLKNEGRSARTVNHHRSDILAFMNWCKKTGRVRQNPLSMVPKLNEQEDRRRIRRPLTDIELARLLEVAAEQDRKNNGRYTPRHVVYLMAAMTGLRRNELRQLTWADVDLKTQTLKVLGVAETAKAINSLPSIRPQPNTANVCAAPGTARTLQNPAFICADMQSSSVAKKSQTEKGRGSEVVANTTVSTNSHHHAPIGTGKRASGFEPPTSSLGS